MSKNTRMKMVVFWAGLSFLVTVLMNPAMGSGSFSPQAETIITPQAFLPIVFKPSPFVKTDSSPLYLQNFANNAGCNWLGMAGEVLDLNRNPVPAGSYVVHVWGSGIDTRLIVGTAPAYSPSGWELFLFDSPVVRDYEIQLELPNATAVSPTYAVQTRASCNENLLRFDFIESG